MMDGEIGAQIAPPIAVPLPSMFHDAPPVTKKRDLAWQSSNLPPNSSANWNPKLFSWDSVRFSVKPSSDEVDSSKNPVLMKNSEEEGEHLALKLGGGGVSATEEERPVPRPSKKVRSGSPGSTGGTGGNYLMCQVDDCKKDLTNAKDYHRRHKVCEAHSKATKALVGKQLQRFCQQCSRFHPLSEFDEGKRSCRRRLAGHNRRRRKTQPEDASLRLSSSGTQGNNGNSNLDIVKLLAILAHWQGNVAGADKVSRGPVVPDKDQINHILNKIHLLQASNTASRSSPPEGLDLNVSQAPEQPSFEHPAKENRNLSTMDLLAVFSTALATSASEGLAAFSQANSDSSGDDKTKITCADPAGNISSHNQLIPILPSGAPARNACSLQLRSEIPKVHLEKDNPSLPLQLFSSEEDDSPLKRGSRRNYLSSDSSSPIEDGSASSSPLVAQKLFPLHSAAESLKHSRISSCQINAPVEERTNHEEITALDLFRESERQVQNGAPQTLLCQPGYTSSSGSDHSPSSLNSDGQNRTGRIIFKLFDKDPSSFPGALRAQILNWLSSSPSEMESYIRPGCVVLSIYASMTSGAWNELERDFLERVSSLVQSSESEFWRSGRFMVRTSRQLALHKDGKIRLCKSWKTWSAPELTLVSPIAVVSGQETSFVLKGRNLTAPGTRIHCTYMGGYISKEVSDSTSSGAIYDCLSIESFSFHGQSHDIGRCFLEVENGFRGNSFPVIIADAAICQELRHLESDFEVDRTTDSITEAQVPSRSREDILHFLNELGWLFQHKNIPPDPLLSKISCEQFNFLLTFSVEHDWPAVVKTVLDMLVERSLMDESLVQESLEMLVEIQLLSRAVKRKCRKMVDLLLHYTVMESSDGSKRYLFPPNAAGSGGITPLHVAASTQDSEDMVNALTDDPQEIGLNCWNSVLDESGQSPYMYASTRNFHSYNELVARKLSDKKNGQISILLGDERAVRSCAQCAIMDIHKFKPIIRNRGILHRPYIHSMLAIAAVCVCVCVLMRDMPKLSNVAPFMWEHLDYGPR